MKHVSSLAVLLLTGVVAASAALSPKPVFLDDQFEMPAGFRIYRAAGGDLTGGSYEIAFDGQGRLLVGDGQAVRRLQDEDGDGVYDRYDVIAEGLGSRGPQGLLVYGDRLYAVGGDGVQMFEGYEGGGVLRHTGRIGEPFHTGGDHTAHTLLRGHDGFLYFITGDGGGVGDRKHITEAHSPAQFERAGSVFRVSPDGARWECLSTGGRNAPNLGINYLGDLFSWDSDMEWHVDVPWYRPLRLNHWVLGGDQGWQEVGAYPSYYLDAVAPVMETGRGSPTWGVFYEHTQFPQKYRDNFLVCDYRWKSATSGGYNRSGRLVAFSLERDGAGWRASMEVMIRPKAGAVDAGGRPIDFSLVDVDVGPDGSIFISDHNQGVWRVVYDPGARFPGGARPVVPVVEALPEGEAALLKLAVSLPQLGSEWSRLRVEAIRTKLGGRFEAGLMRVAEDRGWAIRERLQAVRLLAPGFASLDAGFLERLAGDRSPELRGQAVWLRGLAGSMDLAARLSGEGDSFVRRRAFEALNRAGTADVMPVLLEGLTDGDRRVQYSAMTALSRQRLEGEWLGQRPAAGGPGLVTRVLAAAHLGRRTLPEEWVKRSLGNLIELTGLSRDEQLDVLRVLGIYREAVKGDPELMQKLERYLVGGFPGTDKDVRWEQVRLMGEYGVGSGFGAMLRVLESEEDPVTQFHIARSMARLESGWTPEGGERLKRWFMGTQRGWFADWEGKGRQFPGFWEAVLTEYAGKHQETLARDLTGIDLGGPLGRAVLAGIGRSPEGAAVLIGIYEAAGDLSLRREVLSILGSVRSAGVAAFLRREYAAATEDSTRSVILHGIARMPREKANQALLVEGLGHPDAGTVVECGRALAGYRTVIDRSMADDLLRQVVRRTELTARLSTVLMAMSQVNPRPRFSEGTDRGEIVGYWTRWYEERFGAPFAGGSGQGEPKSNRDQYAFLTGGELAGGDADRGEKVYVKAQCARCHGGAGVETVLFGPDLAGVTRRLQRAELAEAIVYPSKTVAERFQGTEIELKDGEALSGFIVEREAGFVTLALQDRVEKIPMGKIESIRAQELSLMPEGLLSLLTWEEIRDLHAWLDRAGEGN